MPGWIEALIGRTSLLCLLAMGLAGCRPEGPDATLAEYVTRVARVVDATAELAEPEPLPAFPEARSLSVDIPRRTIDVVEFFELHDCDMGELVGLRNSPLGRLQTSSQRLGYEAAWLAALDRCGGGAANWAVALGADKRALLPALFWNATFAAGEMRTALGASAAVPDVDLAFLLRALGDSYRSLMAGSFDITDFEQILNRLRSGSWVGPARARWASWRRHLDAVSALLHDAGDGLCLNQRPTPRSQRLQTVFMSFYVDRIQPELARQMSAHAAWIEELTRLSEPLAGVAPAAYHDWYEAAVDPSREDSEWRRTRRSVTEHARAWQAMLASCGIEPGSGVRQD